MSLVTSAQEEAVARQARILCVDDEPNILSSLRRLLRGQGYQVFLAESGSAGLALLEAQPIDLVISDMRMPEMDGARFLEQVRSKWPDTIRLLLTGYADIQSILDAINRGEIYRYITKPWNDSDIQLIIRHALERKELEREKLRLEELTKCQNEQLTQLNADLEAKVQERTQDLKKALETLVTVNEKLKASFVTSIKVFSGLIGMRNDKLAGHSHRVADLARRIAKKMDMTSAEVQDVFVAGLLHNIGKIAFSDELLAKPVTLMNGELLGQYRKFTLRGEQLLMPLADLQDAARIVRSQQERFDGEGYPDQLSGFNIPLGARILALASDYFNLQIGTMTQRNLRPDEAYNIIMQQSGKRYDPLVANAFQSLLHGSTTQIGGTPRSSNEDRMPEEIVVGSSDLRPGMVIARDLISGDGLLLLSAEHEIDEKMIRQLREFEASPAGSKLSIHVHQRGTAP